MSHYAVFSSSITFTRTIRYFVIIRAVTTFNPSVTSWLLKIANYKLHKNLLSLLIPFLGDLLKYYDDRTILIAAGHLTPKSLRA